MTPGISRLTRRQEIGVLENSMPVEIAMDDIVRMRKPHPCGGYEWRVVRLGADIGIKCLTCGRRVLMPRGEFERRLKAIVQKAVGSDE